MNKLFVYVGFDTKQLDQFVIFMLAFLMDLLFCDLIIYSEVYFFVFKSRLDVRLRLSCWESGHYNMTFGST